MQIVPARATAFITTPLAAGIVVLGEPVPPVCLLSVLFVIVGVLVSTTADPSKHGH